MRRHGLILVLVFSLGSAALAQGPKFKLGSNPTETEIQAIDTLVDQDGKLMPDGEGTVAQGTTLYAQRCAMCHGPNGEGTKSPAGRGPVLVAEDDESAIRRQHFATTIFSYIYRVMPMHQEGTLTVDQTYALTAFLLFRNGIIKENEVMNAKSLPKVIMPKRYEWTPPPETGA